jgi:hypothetical protein
MGLAIERTLPYSVGIFATPCLYLLKTPHQFAAFFTPTLLSASVTYGAIIIGFLATSMAILASIHNTQIMEDIRKFGYIAELYRYLVETMAIAMLSIVVNFVGFFIIGYGISYQLFWFFLMFASSVAFFRTSLIFATILRKLRPNT